MEVYRVKEDFIHFLVGISLILPRRVEESGEMQLWCPLHEKSWRVSVLAIEKLGGGG